MGTALGLPAVHLALVALGPEDFMSQCCAVFRAQGALRHLSWIVPSSSALNGACSWGG